MGSPLSIRKSVFHDCRVSSAGALVGCAALAVLCGTQSRAQAPLGPAKSDSPVTLQKSGGFFTLDLSKKEDKTQPSLRFGYQSQAGEATKRARMKNPEGNVHHLLTYSADLRGIPSDNTASLFKNGDSSTGAQVNLSIGQAFLNSYVPPRNDDVANNILLNLGKQAALIPLALPATGAPNTPLIARRKNKVQELFNGVQTLLASAPDADTKSRRQKIADYAESLLDYLDAADGRSPLPTTPPDQSSLADYKGPLYDAWYLRLGYNGSSNTFFDGKKAFGDQFTKKDFHGYSAQLGYNINLDRSPLGRSIPAIIGISGGVMRTNNADQLSTIEVTETQSFTSADGITKRNTSRKRNGLVGDYRQYEAGVGKIDLVFYPDLNAASRDPKKTRSSFAIDLFGRASGGGTPFVYGVGTYLTQLGAPTKIYGGLNVYRAENKHIAVDIVAGFPF